MSHKIEMTKTFWTSYLTTAVYDAGKYFRMEEITANVETARNEGRIKTDLRPSLLNDGLPRWQFFGRGFNILKTVIFSRAVLKFVQTIRLVKLHDPLYEIVEAQNGIDKIRAYQIAYLFCSTVIMSACGATIGIAAKTENAELLKIGVVSTVVAIAVSFFFLPNGQKDEAKIRALYLKIVNPEIGALHFLEKILPFKKIYAKLCMTALHHTSGEQRL
jgi:hypothetical protein